MFEIEFVCIDPGSLLTAAALHWTSVTHTLRQENAQLDVRVFSVVWKYKKKRHGCVFLFCHYYLGGVVAHFGIMKPRGDWVLFLSNELLWASTGCELCISTRGDTVMHISLPSMCFYSPSAGVRVYFNGSSSRIFRIVLAQFLLVFDIMNYSLFGYHLILIWDIV